MSTIPHHKYRLQGQQILVNSLLIVEVLSASMEGYNRGFKFTAYQSSASFQEYVLVAQERPHMARYVRQADGHRRRGIQFSAPAPVV